MQSTAFGAHTAFAFSYVCLEKRMLDGFVGFSGHNLDHPQLPAIIGCEHQPCVFHEQLLECALQWLCSVQ